jgi:hypothetical protein
MTQPKSQKRKLKTVIRWLVAGLILAPLSWFFYIEAGRILSYIAIRQIARLTNTNISTGLVDFHTDGSVFIEELVISPIEQNGRDTILKAKKVYGQFSVGSVLLLRPRLKVINIDDFVFTAQYDLDTGRSNLSGLKIKYNKSNLGWMPRISLKTGKLQYSKISNGQAQVAVSVPIDASFGFDKNSEDGYSFEITTATMSSGFGKSRLKGLWKPGIVTMSGGISSIDVPELEMAWFVDVLAAEFKYNRNNDFSLKLSVPDLESRRNEALDNLASVGPVFLGKSGVFTALQGFWDLYQPHGMVDAELEMWGNLSRLSESKMAGKVHCKDAAFCYNRFPYAIEHLTGRIDFTKNSVTLNNLSGKHGETRLFINGSCSDFGANLKYGIRITSNKMPLDDDLYDALKPKQKEFWSAFSPTGFAAIDLRLNRQTQTDKEIKLTVELHGAEAAYRNFPYQLQDLTGRLLFNRNKVIFSDVTSQASRRKITLNGEIETRGAYKPATYDFSIKVNNVPLDATLQAALTEKQKNLYQQFCPAGLADGLIKVSTQDSGTASVTADLSFKNTSLKVDQFPLPVSDITAKATFTPYLITIKEFTGQYGNDSVSLTGQVHLDREYRQSDYQLELKLEQVLLNSDLFDLLPDSLRNFISELKPAGRVNLIADLTKESLTEPSDYSVTLECLRNSVNIPKFPYPLKDITGTLTINDNTIKLRDITAITDGNAPPNSSPPTIELNGEIILAGDSYRSALLKLSAENFAFDEQFSRVLPGHVRPMYDRLSPVGSFNLDFENISFFRADNGRKSIVFTGNVDLNNSSIKMSGTTTTLDASLNTKGSYVTGEGLSNCNSLLDGGTLNILGKSFTNLTTDICYDPDSRNWFTRNLMADFYGGKVKGKFEFKQPAGQTEEYVLQTGFENVDLQQFLSDTPSGQAPEKGHTGGIMNGSLSLNAGLGNNSSRIGTCKLSISDMRVGKLSPLAKILQVLQLSLEDHAFEQMYVDSYIKRNSLFVRKLDLSGQRIAFYGSGSMDLQSRNINLALTSRGKRPATDDPSILQSLTEVLGQAVVRMDVTGDLYDPKITTKTLPLLEQTLQIFGSKPDTQN